MLENLYKIILKFWFNNLNILRAFIVNSHQTDTDNYHMKNTKITVLHMTDDR